MPDKRLQTLQSFSHPVISVAVVFSFIFVFDAIFRLTLARLLFTPLPKTILLLPFIFCVESVIFTNRLEKNRSSSLGARIREGVLLLFAAYITVMMVSGYLFKGDLNPLKGEVIYTVTLSFLAWILTTVFHTTLKKRELFIRLSGKSNSSPEILKAVKEAGVEATEAEKAVNKTKSRTIALTIISLFLYVAGRSLNLPGIEVVTLPVMIQLIIAVLVVYSCNWFSWESTSLINGFRTHASDSKKHASLLVVMGLAAVLLAMPFTGDDPVLDPSLINDFMLGLSQQSGERTDNRVDVASLFDRDIQLENKAPPGQYQAGAGNAARYKLTQSIARIAGYVLLAGLVFGVLWFLLAPLFSGEKKFTFSFSGVKQRLRSVVASLTASFKSFLAGLKSFFISSGRTAVKAGRMAVNLSRSVRKAAGNVFVPGQSKGNTRQVSKRLKGFSLLIRWCGKKGVVYQTWMPPLAYLKSVGKTVPEAAEELVSLGEEFEKMVYALKGMTDENSKQFSRRVSDFLKQR